jgi:hypothetical protein
VHVHIDRRARRLNSCAIGHLAENTEEEKGSSQQVIGVRQVCSESRLSSIDLVIAIIDQSTAPCGEKMTRVSFLTFCHR